MDRLRFGLVVLLDRIVDLVKCNTRVEPPVNLFTALLHSRPFIFNPLIKHIQHDGNRSQAIISRSIPSTHPCWAKSCLEIRPSLFAVKTDTQYLDNLLLKSRYIPITTTLPHLLRTTPIPDRFEATARHHRSKTQTQVEESTDGRHSPTPR
jgi:hypothetical protein